MAIAVGSGGGGGGPLQGIPFFGGGLVGSGIPGGYSNWRDYFLHTLPGVDLSAIQPTSQSFGSDFVQPGTTTGTTPGINPSSGGFDWSTVLKTIPILGPILGSLGGGSPSSTGAPNSSGSIGKLLETLLGQAGQIGLPLYGAINQQNQQEWNNAAKISTLNYLQRLGGNAENQLGVQNQYLPQMLQAMGQLGGLGMGAQQNLAQNLGTAIQGAPSAFNTATDMSRVPGTSDIVNWLGGLQGFGKDQLGAMWSTNVDANNPLNTGISNALGLSSAQNPYAKQLEALSQRLTSGQPLGQPNNATLQAMGAAGNILSNNPLMSMDQVRSMAIDQNATQALNAANKQRRDLLNRTGVTGPALASGQQNELLGSSMDQALQNQASGITNAVMQQQGLQNQLYNTGAGLFGSAQNAGLNQQQLALQQLLGGAGLLTGNQGMNINALNALANLQGTQNQGYGAMTNLLNEMSGSSLGEQSALQNLQNFGLQSQNDLYSQLNNLFGTQNQLANSALGGMFNGANYGQNAYNQNLNFLQSLAGNNVGLFGNAAAPQNFFNFGL